MEITINGEKRHVACATGLLADILDAIDIGQGPGIAVAVNSTVVPRGQWATTTIEPGASLEIIRAVQGG